MRICGACATDGREPCQAGNRAALSDFVCVPQLSCVSVCQMVRIFIMGVKRVYLALYRKWRPRTFTDVVSQEHITTTLQNQVKSHKTAHAYLFTGSRGTGKTTCAKILSMAVNCEHSTDGNPCMECDCCKSIIDGTNMDIQEIDAASNNGVDNIRQLREDAYFLPTQSKYRVYIIDETHMLSQAAFNALLKIMEEPPEHVIFIMATTEVQKVPATILSRCQRFDFNRIRTTDIIKRLHHIAEVEGFTMTEEAAAMIARLADGGMRDALSLTDQCIAYQSDITEEVVVHATGVTGRDYLFSVCDCILQNDTAGALGILGDLYDRSKDLQNFCEELSRQFRDIMILKAGNGEVELGFYLPAELKKIRQYTESFSLGRLLRYLQILQETLDAMSKYADKRLNMEMCLIRICNPLTDTAPQTLLARIEQLERALEKGYFPTVTKAAEVEKPPVQESEPIFTPPVEPKPMEMPKPAAPEPTEQISEQPKPQEIPITPPPPEPKPQAAKPVEVEQENEKPIPFSMWETVLEELMKIDPFIYGLVFNAAVFEKGSFLYMKSPMGSLVSNLKKDNAANRLLAVVKQVTGKEYRLRLAKESTASQVTAPAVDPMNELAERARLAGVEIIES